MDYKPLLKMTLGLQSLAIMGEGLKLVPKIDLKKSKIKPIKPMKMVKGFTNILVGTALLKPTASLIQSM